MEKKSVIVQIFRAVISAFYPNSCMCCGDIIPESEQLCDYCFCMLDRSELDKFCLKCGSPKKLCSCKKRVFHFDLTIAPFYNSGIAKRLMHRFKFRRKEHIGKFFARYMVLSVKQYYSDIDFDNIIYVPAEKKTVRKRGYNQSKVLAENMSEILKIPILDNAIFCHHKKYVQHKLALKYRFENVKDIYYSNKSLNGKTVLLVDDIKTTGATLDACSKVLYASGAQRVYCVTGLGPSKPKKRDKKGNKNGN